MEKVKDTLTKTEDELKDLKKVNSHIAASCSDHFAMTVIL